jgi:hypothetical protein
MPGAGPLRKSPQGEAFDAPETACVGSDATRRATATRQPIRLAARALPCALGSAGARSRGDGSGMDGRRSRKSSNLGPADGDENNMCRKQRIHLAACGTGSPN